MRSLVVAVAALAAACASPNETCPVLTPVPSGGYQFCKSGPSCVYHLTDGSVLACASCGDCVAAVDRVVAWCDPSQGGSGAPSLTIPKTDLYTGATLDPR